MKHFRHILFALPLLLMPGCGLIYDDLSDCPPVENVTLLFTRMVAGSDEFGGIVQSVDVMVFDEGGGFVMRKTIPQADLQAFRAAHPDSKSGTRLRLDPGTYRIVGWGNAAGNCSFQNLTAPHTIADALLQHIDGESGTGATCDPLYYAPRMTGTAAPEIFTITVPESGSQTGTLDFTAAHDAVEVYIKGFGSSFGPATDKPEVEITSMSWAYDFLMHPRYDRPFCFVQYAQSVVSGSQTLAGVQFLTAQLNNDNSSLIHIRDPYTHETVYSVELKKFLADNNITLDPTDYDHIQILVEFLGADVRLTVPNWSGTGVTPGF